ncbi:imidazolonepropionase-like amidohydrolase [Streptacidiphilus sp. BW17]|uniref:amidohydrolase family protein n=1 Tax=Streptacidiphilus sp. BW17 TaxID=3156274 RepID=UPI003511A9E4
MSEFVIAGAQVFNGERRLGPVDVHVADGVITAVGGPGRSGAEVVDARGATLLPGLIDAHTHSDEAALRQALTFGVTTELDLTSMPETMIPLRRTTAGSLDLADVRSASVGLTPEGGHPHQLRKGLDGVWPTASSVAEVPGFVADRVAEGADYLKVMIEDGHVLGARVPVLAQDVLLAAVREAHANGLKVLAHALTLDATRRAVDAGVDGLTHLFVDAPYTPQIIARIAEAGVFVIPTLSVLASITGQGASAELAADPRVRPKVPQVWLESLAETWHTLPQHNFQYALASVAALHAAGVDVLAGTDAAHLGAPGTAHGASLHGELRLLVRAGLTPLQTLRAATALAAEHFDLPGRGRIEPGKRADLLLVDGDPTADMGDTLSVRAVWRQGVPLAVESARA